MTTTTTVLLPYLGPQVTQVDVKEILYVLGIIAALIGLLIAVLAWSRWRYRKEQSKLMDEYTTQQSNFIGSLKAEAAHYRAQTSTMEKELCSIKERLAREIGELRGEMASLERIMRGRCRYYQPQSADEPACMYCEHPDAWGRCGMVQGLPEGAE